MQPNDGTGGTGIGGHPKKGAEMRILVCGAGFIAGELLKRFGDNWQVTLVDKDQALLDRYARDHGAIVRVLAGDASSPVVLEEAGLDEQEYAVALTQDDRINLAVARFARQAGIQNILSLVHQPENLPLFQELEVQTVTVSRAISSTIFHWLQDPRIMVTNVAQGRAELLEIEVGPHMNLDGRSLSLVHHPNWRVVGLIRQSKLLSYDTETVLRKGDRLLILGQSDVFKEVCSMLACGEPHFPRIYGNSLALGVPLQAAAQGERLLKESYYLIKNTKLQHMTAFCEDPVLRKALETSVHMEGLNVEIQDVSDKLVASLQDHAGRFNLGIVVLPLLERGFMDMLTRPVHIALAHALACPLLVSKGSMPYGRILVPFNGSPTTEKALEVAIDLANQLQADISALIVKEPEFLHGTEDEDTWGAHTLAKVRQLAHVYKTNVDPIVQTGNPVTEITALAGKFDLMVIGSTNRDKEILTPHVGELLVRKSPCSVLILTH